MAGPAGLPNFQKHRVLVAIDFDIDNGLCVSGRFAFDPQALPRSAPIRRPAGFNRRLQGLSIHPGQHQNLMGFHVLGDGSDQAVRIEVRSQLKRLVLSRAGQWRIK